MSGVLPFKSIPVLWEPVQIRRRRWRRGQQSPKSVECPVVDATVDVERAEAGDTKEP